MIDSHEKFRRSLRLKEYNYSAAGYCFVTICTKDRENFFGKITDDKMHLSVIGKIAKECWESIPSHFKNVTLDVFVIMPNHIHGIRVIEEENESMQNESAAVGNGHARSLQRAHQKIPVIIGSFKSAVTKQTSQNIPFAWQKSYHDHIIRHQKSLENIRDYIIYNPLQWEQDRENKQFLQHQNSSEKSKNIKRYYQRLFET